MKHTVEIPCGIGDTAWILRYDYKADKIVIVAFEIGSIELLEIYNGDRKPPTIAINISDKHHYYGAHPTGYCGLGAEAYLSEREAQSALAEYNKEKWWAIKIGKRRYRSKGFNTLLGTFSFIHQQTRACVLCKWATRKKLNTSCEECLKTDDLDAFVFSSISVSPKMYEYIMKAELRENERRTAENDTTVPI